MTSGKIYSGEYSNFEILLGRMQDECKPGVWVMFNAWWTPENNAYMVTWIREMSDPPPVVMGETKYGTAYRLDMQRHPNMFDVFAMPDFGLVEDREGWDTANFKTNHLEYFYHALVLKTSNFKEFRYPKYPGILVLDDDHPKVANQFEEYIRW